MPLRNKIFISYSHKDTKWLDQIKTHLKPLVRTANFEVWDDTKINSGEEWKSEITKALDTSKVAILLVSPNFLASDFIYENELPHILSAVEKSEMKLFWVLLSHCLYTSTDLKKIEPAHNVKKPLDSLPSFKQNEVLTKVCKNIKNAYSSENEMTPVVDQYSLGITATPEVAPDDWSTTQGGLWSQIKRFLKL